MQPRFIAIVLGLLVQSHAATIVTLYNGLLPTEAFLIVDDRGAPIDSADLSLSVGTLEATFIPTLGDLNPLNDDQIIIDAFMPTGSSTTAIPGSLPGYFNTILDDTDPGNSLLGQNIYLLIEHTTAPEAQVILIDLNVTFPVQDAVGLASATSGSPIALDDVLFGETAGGTGVSVDLSTFPEILQTEGFSRGITFDPIPEPSTTLLIALTGLGLCIRRQLLRC